MNIEIGEIYYLCQTNCTGEYIKPTTKEISGWGFLCIFYIGNLYKTFKGQNREETCITLNELKNSILIHNKDFHKYPDLCKDLSPHLTKKQFKMYKRQISLDNIIDNL